jgi:hypothetical protein
MKTRLLHPLWTHVPAIAALIFIIVYTIVSGPLPAQAAVHFDFSGTPDNFSSPYMVFGIITGLSVLYIGLSVFFDELWARQEKRKRFNWISLFDELTVGFIAGVYTGYINYLKNAESTFTFAWILILIIAGSLLIMAVFLDRLRPFRPNPKKISFGDTATREKDLAEKIKRGDSFIHWESQNPFWVALITVVFPIILLAVAVVVWFSIPWVSLVLVVTALMMVFPYGGIQTTVTRQEITVRFGIIGLRVLRLKTDEIENIELAEFSPIADFGGYGIRFNREMQAYFMRGNRGIKLTTTKGKRYIVGSDNPEELYAVAKAVVKSTE